MKKLANESYRDARHAPKPGDVIKKWTDAEITECFKNIEVIVTAYFNTLFTKTGPTVKDSSSSKRVRLCRGSRVHVNRMSTRMKAMKPTCPKSA